MFEDTHRQPMARRLSVLASVVLLQAAIVYGVLLASGEQAAPVVRPPLLAAIVVPPKPPRIVVPPPPPKLAPPPPVFVPLPLVTVAPPPAPPPVAVTTHVRPVSPPPVPAPQPAPQPVAPPKPAPIRTSPSLDRAQSCAPPAYPEAAEEMGQTGTSILQFLSDRTGAVVSSRVARSSGHDALDQAAAVALSRCRFIPARDATGAPQEAWTSISYVWQLN